MIDLHTHTTASDGTDSPAGLVAAAAAAGITTLAITDHDTTSGWADAARAAGDHGIDLVRGIEISCGHRGTSVHLLAYLVDPESPALAAELGAARASRERRLERMVDLMAADGIPIDMAQVQAQVAYGATVGRPHIADALVAGGVFPDRDAAFAEVLDAGSRYYVPHYAPDPVAAVRLVLEAGGVPVMAHPFAGRRGRTVDVGVIERMAGAGLAGLEARHSDHDDRERAAAEDLAEQLGLFVTGSSDYHGHGKTNVLGENTTSPEVLAEIEARATGPVAVVRP